MKIAGATLFIISVLAVLFFLTQSPPAHAVSVELGPVELELNPGDEYSGSITVTNPDSFPVDVRIYQGDWQQTPDGEKYLETGEEPKSLSDWMTVSPSRITIPAGGEEKVYYKLNVPQDEQLSGSYWGIFFVEAEHQDDVINPETVDKPQLGIRIVVRHGVKVYVTIPGTDEAKASFTKATLTPLPDTGNVFTATFENQGNTYLRPVVWLELRDMTGNTVYKATSNKLSILPGISRDYVFELKGLDMEPGKYIALIIADYGLPGLIGAQAILEVE